VELGLRLSDIDANGRTIWIADAHRDNGKRFVARANEKLRLFPLRMIFNMQANKEPIQ
jgi:hypothetical protein